MEVLFVYLQVECTSYLWITLTSACNAELYNFLCCYPEEALEQTARLGFSDTTWMQI